MTLPEDEPVGDQSADDESQPDETTSEIDDTSSETDETSSETDGTSSEIEDTSSETNGIGSNTPRPDPSTVEVDTAQLDRAQDAIDEAREAVKKVARTDSIDEEATGAGELPPFADSVAGVEKSEPPEDDTDSGTEGHAELVEDEDAEDDRGD